jgi:signal transduction histidine kinase
MPSVLKAVWFRNAVLYALLFVGVAGLAGFLTYRSVAQELRAAVLEAVSKDQDAMMAEYKTGGLPALKEAVAERLTETSGAERLYSLETADGKAASSGNIGSMPAPLVFDGFVQPITTTPATSNMVIHAVGSSVEFAGGKLFVGRNVSTLDLTLNVLRGSFVAASALLFFAALALGTLLGLHSERRIAAMAADMRRVVKSGMSERLNDYGSSNEYDRLTSDINRMLDQLQRLMDGIRHVTTNIAHDLRTPLFRLRQNLEQLHQVRELDTDGSAALANCSSEIDRMNETFAALLRIAEVEDGSRRQAFTKIDLSELIIELEELYAESAAAAGLQLVCDFEYGVRTWGDRELLFQMGANLVENAMHYGLEGGKIGLRLVTNGRRATIIVSDAGPGIPASEHDKVFRRLYKIEKSRNTKGHGLGLSLVAAIADLHFAEIKLADNSPGLKVEISLPAFPQPEVQAR